MNYRSSSDGSQCPVLNAIVKVVQPVRHMQTALEASSINTMHIVPPMLKKVRSNLRTLSLGVAVGSSDTLPGSHMSRMSGLVLDELWKL